MIGQINNTAGREAEIEETAPVIGAAGTADLFRAPTLTGNPALDAAIHNIVEEYRMSPDALSGLLELLEPIAQRLTVLPEVGSSNPNDFVLTWRSSPLQNFDLVWVGLCPNCSIGVGQPVLGIYTYRDNMTSRYCKTGNFNYEDPERVLTILGLML